MKETYICKYVFEFPKPYWCYVVIMRSTSPRSLTLTWLSPEPINRVITIEFCYYIQRKLTGSPLTDLTYRLNAR
jgi:hypothetical protein